MKQCTKCLQTKSLDEFRNKSKSKDGKQPWCRSCFAEYERVRYHNGDAERKRFNDRVRVQKNKEYVKSYLQLHPCEDCGDTDWWALDFDHIDQAEKSSEICLIIRDGGFERLQKEILKCRVLCVKCHRRRTIKQMGWWRTFD